MSAPHFFAADVTGDIVTLTGDDAQHARRALRIRAGEHITVSDGLGSVVRAEVEDVGTVLRARVFERTQVPQPSPTVVAYPAVPKAAKLDLVVQKLTELGVDVIRPWFAARTVVRWDAAKSHANGERWRALAHEASKQSRRAWLPEVADPGNIDPLPPHLFVMHEEATERFADALPGVPSGPLGVVTGPEGGLSSDEVDALCARGARAVTLGAPILRTETASLVAATLLLARYGRIG